MSSTGDEYRDGFDEAGERIEIRRGQGATLEKLSVRARVRGYAANELVGDIAQGDRQVLILAEDVTLDPPFNGDDRLFVRGQLLAIRGGVDDSTHRECGVLLAYVVQARGH